jgi:hypothetical protein
LYAFIDIDFCGGSSLLDFLRQVDQIEILSCDLLVKLQHVFGLVFEVAGSVETVGNDQTITDVVLGGHVPVINLHKPIVYLQELLLNWANHIERQLNFGLGISGFDGGANNGDEVASLTDAVDRRHHHNVDVVLPAQLLLRDDDLDRWHVVGVGDWVVQDADAPQYALGQAHAVLEAGVVDVGGVADHHVALSHLAVALDSDDFASLEENFIDVGVEHEGSTVDGADTGEALGDTAQPVDGVDEGGVTISAHRIHVQLDLVNDVDGWKLHEALVVVEGDCVADEVDCVGLQFEFIEHVLGGLVDIDS